MCQGDADKRHSADCYKPDQRFHHDDYPPTIHFVPAQQPDFFFRGLRYWKKAQANRDGGTESTPTEYWYELSFEKPWGEEPGN